MKRWLILGVVAAQIGTLAFMAGQREWIVRTGDTVLMRTAPIDPNDPMRGEYARLHYEISSVPRELCRDGVAAWFSNGLGYSHDRRDQRVYAVLERDEAGIASVIALTDRKPDQGLFIRGRVKWLDGYAVHVRYGIEALFMEQGRALEFERKARDERVGVPVNAEVALGSGGIGVLRAYHWEPLGIEVSFERREAVEPTPVGPVRPRPGVSRAVVRLKNHGESPLAIVDLPDGGSFRLIQAEMRSDRSYVPVPRGEPPAVRDDHVRVLQPGASHEIVLDFSLPQWFVQKPPGDGEPASEPVPMEALTNVWGTWFRIEYAPPSAATSAGLRDAALIRHARLRSRMFNPSGGVD